MKKIIALMLTLAMALSLAACGGSSSASTETTEAAASGAASADASSGAASSEAADASGAASAETADAAGESDLAYVKEKGTLVVGITDFEPMDYKDDSGEWIGFDADLARKFAENLGVTAEFVEIDWDNKALELDGKSIDCVWNGMTLTDEVRSAMECSQAYLNNAQVVVVKSDVADQYQDVASLADLTFAVEAGSAGKEQADANGLKYTEVQNQAAALMEVAAGTSDAAIIDSLMAAAMVGEGTSYADMTYTVGLNSEEYGVGFRKGSDLASELNSFLDTCKSNGTLEQIAGTYKVQAALVK